MNPLSNNQTIKKKTSTAWNKIKTLLSTKTPCMENEIDYYHQYIFPDKASRLLKKKGQKTDIDYIPFAKRK